MSTITIEYENRIRWAECVAFWKFSRKTKLIVNQTVIRHSSSYCRSPNVSHLYHVLDANMFVGLAFILYSLKLCEDNDEKKSWWLYFQMIWHQAYNLFCWRQPINPMAAFNVYSMPSFNISMWAKPSLYCMHNEFDYDESFRNFNFSQQYCDSLWGWY